MLIYEGSIKRFFDDVRDNRISGIMAEAFTSKLGRHAPQSEINSWQNSLSRVKDLIEIAELNDNMIVLEYEVPYNQSRIDCLLFGKDSSENSNVVLIELKQWTDVRAFEDEGNFVETYTGGAKRLVAHPSQQVKGYQNYLKNFISEFDSPTPMVLFSCSYCHNYSKKENDGLFDPIYSTLVTDFPVYTKEDVRPLANKIKELLASGSGLEVFNRFMQSPLKPSQKLLENVTKIVKNEVVFSLLNEQLVAKNLI